MRSDSYKRAQQPPGATTSSLQQGATMQRQRRSARVVANTNTIQWQRPFVVGVVDVDTTATLITPRRLDSKVKVRKISDHHCRRLLQINKPWTTITTSAINKSQQVTCQAKRAAAARRDEEIPRSISTRPCICNPKLAMSRNQTGAVVAVPRAPVKCHPNRVALIP